MKRAACQQSDTRPNQCVPHRHTLGDIHVRRVIPHANGQCLQDFGDIFDIPLDDDAAVVAMLSDDYTILLIRTESHLYYMRDHGARMIFAGESNESIKHRSNLYSAFRIPLDGFRSEWCTTPFDRLNTLLFNAGIKPMCTNNSASLRGLDPSNRVIGYITHYHHAESKTVFSVRFSYTRRDLERHEEKVCLTMMYLHHIFDMYGVPSRDLMPLVFGGENWYHWVLHYEEAEADIALERNSKSFKLIAPMMD